MNANTLRSVIWAWVNGTAPRRLPPAVIDALLDALTADDTETDDTRAILDFCGFSAA